MKNLEDLTTEVSNTSLNPLQKKEALKTKEFYDKLLNILERDKGELLINGKVKQGAKPAESTTILRDLLYKEIESLKLSIPCR